MRKNVVLIVEDNEQLREVLMHLVSHFGYECLEAVSAEEARSLIEEHHQLLRAVLTDFQLQSGTGLQVLRFIEERGGNIPAILMTGGLHEEVESQYSHISALAKPFSPTDLRMALDGLSATA